MEQTQGLGVVAKAIAAQGGNHRTLLRVFLPLPASRCLLSAPFPGCLWVAQPGEGSHSHSHKDFLKVYIAVAFRGAGAAPPGPAPQPQPLMTVCCINIYLFGDVIY